MTEESIKLIDIENDSYDEVFKKLNNNFTILSSRMGSLEARRTIESFTPDDDTQVLYKLLDGEFIRGTNSVEVYIGNERTFDFVELSNSSIQLGSPVLAKTRVTIIYFNYNGLTPGLLDQAIKDCEEFNKSAANINENLEAIKDIWSSDQKDAIDDLITKASKLEETYAPRLLAAENKLGKVVTATDLEDKFTVLNLTKADKREVNNLIISAVNGSPAGRYDTLDALTRALPTGSTRMYVVKSNNQLYYWDEKGKAWTSIGDAHQGQVSSTDKTPLGQFGQLLSLNYGGVNFDSTTHKILNEDGLIVLYQNSILTVTNVTYGSTDDIINTITFNVDTNELKFEPLVGSGGNYTEHSLSENCIVVGYASWSNNDYAINGIALANGKPALLGVNPDKPSALIIVPEPLEVSVEDGSGKTTVNFKNTQITYRDQSFTIPDQSITFTPDAQSVDKTIDFYLDATGPSVKVVASQPLKDKLDKVSAYHYYHLFSINDKHIYSTSNVFVVNGRSNNGWSDTKYDYSQANASYISGGRIKIDESSDKLTISNSSDTVLVTNEGQITLPAQSYQLNIKDKSKPIWIYVDSTNLEYVTRLSDNTTDIADFMRPSLITILINGKAYKTDEVTMQMLVINGVENGGWVRSDTIPMASVIDPNSTFKAFYSSTDKVLTVSITSTNQDSSQKVLTPTGEIEVPKQSINISTDNLDSSKWIYVNVLTGTLKYKDSSGNTNIDSTDASNLMLLAAFTNRRLSLSTDSTKEHTTVDGVKLGGWDDTSYEDNWNRSEFLIPDDLYVVKNSPVTIQPENLLMIDPIDTRIIHQTEWMATETDSQNSLMINDPLSGDSDSFISAISKSNYSTTLSKKVTIHSVDSTSLRSAPSILVIDDGSAINEHKVKTWITDQANQVTPSLIGTIGDTDKSESRPNWSLGMLSYNSREGRPKASTDLNSINTNPFINGDAFDFSYYMNSQKFTKVDQVIISMGLYDFTKTVDGKSQITIDEDGIDSIINSLKIISDSIIKFNKNIKVGYVLPSLPGFNNDQRFIMKNAYASIISQLSKNTNISLISSFLASSNLYGKALTTGSITFNKFSTNKSSMQSGFEDDEVNQSINSRWVANWVLNHLV